MVLGVALIVIAAMSVRPLERFGEFDRAESVKGYWASLQHFVEENGRYPKDDKEISAFFHTTSEKEPVNYIPPQDTNADEVVL